MFYVGLPEWTRSYCFLDVKTKDQADRTVHGLNGKVMLGRPIEIYPLLSGQGPNTMRSRRGSTLVPNHGTGQEPSKPRKVNKEQPWHLWVCGLPYKAKDEAIHRYVQDLFKGYEM